VTIEHRAPRTPASRVPRGADHAGGPPWKLVVAADAPWSGDLYSTRLGRRRFAFSSLETFCGALLAATDWPIGMASAASETRRGNKARPSHPFGSAAAAGKLIVSANAPWTGVLYRTRPGLGHFPFDTFEGFFGAMLDVTGWTLNHDPSGGTTPRTDGPSLSRPTSSR
jgi:hypothetical protein